jgi:multisubunit Na+/H+ antiporter MnhE subunit
MPLLTVVIVVLTAWGVGAAAGSASDYLTGAVVGVVAALVLFAILGAIAAWRHPTERDQSLTPY